MKAAEDGRRYDAAHVLDGATDRSVFVERPRCVAQVRQPSLAQNRGNFCYLSDAPRWRTARASIPGEIMVLGASCVSPRPQLKREQSPKPEFGWIPANLCDLSKG